MPSGFVYFKQYNITAKQMYENLLALHTVDPSNQEVITQWEPVRMGGNLLALVFQACFSKFLDHHSSSLAPTTPRVPPPSVVMIESVCFTLCTQKQWKTMKIGRKIDKNRLHTARKGWKKHISAQLETLRMFMDSCPDSWDATHSFGETKKLNFGVVIRKTLDFSLFQGKVWILDVFLKKHC